MWYAIELRRVLTGHENPPCWGDLHRSMWYSCSRRGIRRRAYCREVHWAWTIKWFTSRAYFRIKELFQIAAEVVAKRGRPFQPTNIEEDTVLLRAWTGHLKAILRREPWRFELCHTKEWKERLIRFHIMDAAQRDLLRGVCPLCGKVGLPCLECGTPAVRRGEKGKPEAVLS